MKPLLILALAATPMTATQADLLEPLQPLVAELQSEFDQIPEERREALGEIAAHIRERREAGEPARLTFICTHNSRRSHLAQVWAAAAARAYGVPQIESFSGGTEATACNPRTVRALRRAGFSVTTTEPEADNPVYHVQFSASQAPLRCFSKVYHHEDNPQQDFAAVMTCSDADERCPFVAGCAIRVAIPYVDPKVSDDTDAEAATYDERLRQIGREMLFMMSRAGE